MRKFRCTRDGWMSEGTDDDECQVMAKAYQAFCQVTLKLWSISGRLHPDFAL